MIKTVDKKESSPSLKIPEWFKTSKGKLSATRKLSKQLQMKVPNSICEEAKCPNRSDCFDKGVLTFMILGTTCTRNCGFCSVAHGKPLAPDPAEVNTILKAIESLGLKFVVLTSPNRDDLKDGGSLHYHNIVAAIKKYYPHVKVEVLIPDFKENYSALETVISSHPDVINHNIETVPSLYRSVRKGSLYDRSLRLLKKTKALAPHILTKSGLMLGLGETEPELLSTFKDIQAADVDILTLGQYLKPTKDNLEVKKYYHPDEFKKIGKQAEIIGFRYVFSGPLIRSSYLAEHVFDETMSS